jgi:apolipoprotein D and lipocalin family protein
MHSLRRRFALAAFALAFLSPGIRAATGDPARPDLTPVPHLDLPRYMGRWYVISHVPNFLEKDKVGTSDNYTLLPDGTLRDVFVFRRHSLAAPEEQWSGPGWITDRATNASWKVRLFWPFKAGYHVLELDPNYQWAVACTDSGKLFWILSRSPTLEEAVQREIKARLARRGLDPSQLEPVAQRAGP